MASFTFCICDLKYYDLLKIRRQLTFNGLHSGMLQNIEETYHRCENLKSYEYFTYVMLCRWHWQFTTSPLPAHKAIHAPHFPFHAFYCIESIRRTEKETQTLHHALAFHFYMLCSYTGGNKALACVWVTLHASV